MKQNGKYQHYNERVLYRLFVQPTRRTQIHSQSASGWAQLEDREYGLDGKRIYEGISVLILQQPLQHE